MTGAADIVAFAPGRRVPVEVVADAGGTVATRGQGVELAGENETHTEVSLVGTAGNGVGIITTDPADFTESQGDYEAGDSAGETSVVMAGPVIAATAIDDFDSATTGVQEPTVGDAVQFEAGGDVGPHDEADAPAPYGLIFATRADSFARAGKVQVAVQR